MNISTSIHLLAPKDHRWSAIDDETYDGAPDTTPRSPIGWGETQLDAVIDLIEQINDREEAELQTKGRGRRSPRCGRARNQSAGF